MGITRFFPSDRPPLKNHRSRLREIKVGEIKLWRNHCDHLITLFDFPQEICKVIGATNTIESLNSVRLQATKRRKIFPYERSTLKSGDACPRLEAGTRPIQ